MTPEAMMTARHVDEAHARIRSFLRPTRLIGIDHPGHRRVWLKLENEQPTGSFKVRGALSNLSCQAEAPAGFVTASAGNHGLGLAWAAQQLGRRETVTIFVPGSAPETKVGNLKQYPVDLRIAGRTFEDAERAAKEFGRASGARFIHAYDDPLTAAGQGTVAVEVKSAVGLIGTVVVPVGGGGLISGSASWLKERSPGVKIVAVQPAASPALSESVRLGRALLEYPADPTLADGLSGGIGSMVFAHRHLIDQILNVPEERIRQAIRSLHVQAAVRAEASGAIAFGALSLPESAGWPGPIVCVITGGNIDDAVFASLVA